MHAKRPLTDKKRAPMIRYRSEKQLPLEGFETPFETALDKNNRWVKLSECIPWDLLADSYYETLSVKEGRPAKDARLVIGAVIIKHKLCLSDEETVDQIQENPYLQYFVGLPGYQTEAPFVPSLFVEIRKRMGQAMFDAFHGAIIEAVDAKRPKEAQIPIGRDTVENDDDPPPPDESKSTEEKPLNQGKLIIDATVANQAIRYPTDLSLLNEGREFSEQIIDLLHSKSERNKKKPRTYREKARKAYLAVVKLRRPGRKVLRRGIKQQLQYLRRNLKHIEGLLDEWPPGTSIPLPHWLLRRYWVLPHLYQQQHEMHRNNVRRCDDRIVSISQPYVRPIVRGKQDKPVEFGAKLSASLTGAGLAHIDALRWNAFNEGSDLEGQVEAYKKRYGHYPEAVLGDPAYGTQANRRYLKQHGIRFAGKPLGRPKKVTDANKEELKRLKAQRQQEYRERIPIEGKFGQGKNGYRLNYIRAKRADTSLAWINSIFLVMNLLILLRVFLGLCKSGLLTAVLRTRRHMNRLWVWIVSSFRAQSAMGLPDQRNAVLTF